MLKLACSLAALLLLAGSSTRTFAAQQAHLPAPSMTRLERLGRDALAIVVVNLDQRFRPSRMASVGARRDKDAPPEFAEARCSVERVLYGHAELERSILRATIGGAQVAELMQLDKQTRILLFLAEDPIDALSPERRRDVHELPVSALDAGARPLAGSAHSPRLVVPATVFPLPDALTRTPDAPLLLEPLAEWLAALSERTTPSIRTAIVSTGPSPYYRRLDRDGFFRSTEVPNEGRLAERDTAEIFARWTELRVDALPLSFGPGSGPCGSTTVITVKGRDRVRTIRCWPADDANVPDPLERERIACARDVVELLRTL
jgi:hypothetical protein